MANWSNPALTSTYTDFLNQLKDRDTDLALQFDGTTSTNLATGTIRWNSTQNRWQKWNGTSWAELTATYALTGLSTTGNATVSGNLSVTGSTALAGATATTPATADNNTNVATTAFVKAQNYAPLASPTLTGTPAAPTASAGTNTTQIATTAFVNAEIANDAVLLSGGTMSGALTLSQDPTSDMHAVTKRWVESLAPKEACRVSTTANITLSGLQTIDGISVSVGDRVLVRAQSNVPENGIYVASSGAWSRASDANTWDDLVGATVSVTLGTANAYTTWLSTAAPGGTIDASIFLWQLTSNQQVSAIGNLSGIGLVTRTGANTFGVRSLFVNGIGLTVSDQNGAYVGPTISSNATSTGTTANTIISRGTNGDFTAGTATLFSFSYSGSPTTTSTGALQVPFGNTAQRPLAATGHVRYNSELAQFEGYNGSAWGTLGVGTNVVTTTLKNSSSATTNITLNTDGTTTLTPSNIIKSATAQSASGWVAINFENIPSWVKVITVMLDELSTSSTGVPCLRLGTSVSVETANYKSGVTNIGSSSVATQLSDSSGFELVTTGAAASTYTGQCRLTNISGNVWILQGGTHNGTTSQQLFSGRKTLAGTLTRVRITTTAQTDTFDGGTVNIMYEG